jgi:hypothetical protein
MLRLRQRVGTGGITGYLENELTRCGREGLDFSRGSYCGCSNLVEELNITLLLLVNIVKT